jgi:protease I
MPARGLAQSCFDERVRGVAGLKQKEVCMTGKEDLKGKKVAILVADGFEEVELMEPRQALEDAGATTVVVSPAKGKVKGWKMTDWGKEVKVDTPLAEARADQFDALLLPGGVMNPDHLRREPQAVRFVRSFFDAGKPVAAICHGPWMLAEADVVRGREITSFPSIKTDLKNAGARWVDKEVVADGNLVTSRKPDDIPAFNREMVALFAKSEVAAPVGR